jgi:hypothetical protein
MTVLIILDKFSFILYPIVLKKVKVVVRKLLLKLFWLLVIKLAIAVELLIKPLSIVSRSAFLVIKDALSVYLVAVKVAFIISSI